MATDSTSRPPRLRFAPSPTGPLHLGGARTAIYNQVAARALGGKFLLRIEDTDRARSTDESLRIILDGLRWLGVDWDEGPEVGGDFGPYFQTERLERYRAYADRLLEGGHAYRCYATPEEVEAGRQAQVEAGKRPMYDRRDRDLTDEQRSAFEAEGRSASLRFRMPLTGSIVVDDVIKGPVEVQLEELDDWVMVRPDGMPTYNFVCVCDDIDMQISHVVRGDEHFLNGAKQTVLYGLLGAEPPKFAHIPLILGDDGKKLSKRTASTNILDYRDRGYPPDAVFNYISLLGWSYSGDRDVFTRQEMIDKFRLADIHKGGAKFDEQKLLALCGDHIRMMSRADLVAAVRPFVTAAAGAFGDQVFESAPAFAENVIACFQQRLQLYTELADKIDPFVADPIEYDAGAMKNLRKREQAPQWLRAYADVVAASNAPPSYPAERGVADTEVMLPTIDDAPPPTETSPTFDPPAELHHQAKALTEKLEAKFGHFVGPVRAALSGTDRGPGLFDIIYLLGKERAVARLRAGG